MASKPEEFSLPMASINRIIKDSLPDGTIVSKEAKLALMKATCVFILYSTAISNEFASKAHRRTLYAEDMFQALEDMGLSEFIPDLRAMLDSYKASSKGRKATLKKQKSSEMEAAESGEAEGVDMEERPMSDDIFNDEVGSGAVEIDYSQASD